MVKDNDESWTLPQRKTITKEVLDCAIGAEEEAASSKHQAREAWFDGQHGTMVTRIMEKSPLAIKRFAARLAGLATSPTKALASVRNGRLRGDRIQPQAAAGPVSQEGRMS